MAKRLTDSNKWNDNWYSNLPMDIKLVWNYLLDTCDHAGVYKVNLKLLRFQTDCDRSETDIIEYLKERIYIKGDKWFIPKFITFQYKNFFTSNTPAIKSARELLLSHCIIEPSDNSFDKINKELSKPSITLIEPLSNGYLTTKDKDMDTDMDKSMSMNKNMGNDMDEYMDNVFKEDIEKDKDFRKDMYEYMDTTSPISVAKPIVTTEQFNNTFGDII
jgi:hypothetical protein